MRRFAIFAIALLVIVIVGSQPRAAGSQKHSFCVCMATKAALLMRSIARTPDTTTAQAQPDPHTAKAASAAE